MNVYHHAAGSAHLISCGSSIPLPLGSDAEDDYLHISMVSGPGNLKRKCVIWLPVWADFQFSADEKITLSHGRERIKLEVSPGLPTWQLKITRPASCRAAVTGDNVIVGCD